MKIILLFAISLLAKGIKGQDTLKTSPESIDTNSAFYKMEIESKYPGGDKEWNNFLIRVMRYPDAAARERIQGMVLVRFIVDKDGTVSHIIAISGPPELREEAERVVRRSGKWIPAFQHGHYLKSYKQQPFVFKMN
jgi:periplasmic protein TonB